MWIRRLALAAGVLVAAAAGLGLLAWLRLSASLPALDGSAALPGLSAPVRIERDALGVPRIRAASRADAARAMGFLHAQERFFQMDLQRRRAAGELAELVGGAALPLDRDVRVHRFRARAARVLAAASAADRALIEAYTEGVNAGLAALGAPPFEYQILGTPPARWRPEDSVLTVLAMYLVLQGELEGEEANRALLRDTLPEPLFRFLTPKSDGWDAPLVGTALEVPPIPGPEIFDLRGRRLPDLPPPPPGSELPPAGSNNWALAGAHSAGAGALVANDMHLGWSVPNIWYRASLEYPGPGGDLRRITGVTLPGEGFVVVGSNGDVAWGFTNSMGDWEDLVVLDPAPGDAAAYLTPDGAHRLERFSEVLHVRGGADETLEVEESIWGPVVRKDHRGRRLAARWVAHDPEAVNLRLGDLDGARNVDEALAIAARAGVPAQNFVCGDRAGRIAWTIIGPMPRRVGFDGFLPTSWADGSRRWDGWLAPSEHPRVVDPPGGRIWSANQRVVDGAALAAIGVGNYVSGARARQIRDDLANLEGATERDLLAVQLDNRALFLARWRDLLLGLLDPAALAQHPRRSALRSLLEGWNARADGGSAAYRMLRAFRDRAFAQLFAPIVAEARAADPRFSYSATGFLQEGPLWRLVSEHPAHLLDPRFASWRERLLALVDDTLADVAPRGEPLDAERWGSVNRLEMHHPLSRVLPLAGSWLDMPESPLGGDGYMPNALTSLWGPSERMAVSPGHEEQGILHMPGGQSGHPLSPYYRAGHEAWLHGEPLPFLPGPAQHVLELVPAAPAAHARGWPSAAAAG